MNILTLYVTVPVACFRVAQAREFWESYPCPPPSTVYGMLLSLVGEENRLHHLGAEIAYMLCAIPHHSVIVRTLWRVKDLRIDPGTKSNKRPDFQELLSNIEMIVFIRSGQNEQAQPTLMERLENAFHNPSSINRFGGVSLGESTHMVNDLCLWSTDMPLKGRLLLANPKGDLSLPIFPDHIGSKKTIWGQFSLTEHKETLLPLPEQAWISIDKTGGSGEQ